MPTQNGRQQEALYACKCLNVRLRSTPPPYGQADFPPASEYTTVYVARDEDIKIIYPHLTLRSRYRGPFIPDPTRCARYTSLTCLTCQALVYRIHQIVSTDDEVNLKEGPIITKGWAETEVLRSSSGWLEVHSNDILTGQEAISRQENSPQFSKLFGIVLPVVSIVSPLTQDPVIDPPSAPPSLPKYKLPFIPPVFPESKSNRSLFATLASIASQQSASIRSEIEEYIDGIVKEKVEEVKHAEAQLKRDVQTLLTKYNEGIKKAEQEQSALISQQLSQSRTNERSPSPPVSPASPSFPGAPMSVVREFVPMRVPSESSGKARQFPVAASAPRVSALSASLATSSFHYPQARADAAKADSIPSRSHTPDSLQSATSTTLTSLQLNPEVRNVFQFRRNNNDEMNTAASYRYFLIEEEMEKVRKDRDHQKQAPAAQDGNAVASSQQPLAGPSGDKATAKTNGTGRQEEKRVERKEQGTVPALDGTRPAGTKSASPSPSPKSKGKRKVTFDVRVDSETKPVEHDVDSGEMLFDLEEELGQRRDASEQQAPPLLEQSVPVRPRTRKQNSGGLPASFSTLRPASLPSPPSAPLLLSGQSSGQSSPSDRHRRRSPSPTAKSSLENDNTREASGIPMPDGNASGNIDAVDDASSSNLHDPEGKRKEEEDILRLVAAGLPSHRAAWRNNRKVYETFVRGYDLNDGESPEEREEGIDEGNEDQQPMAFAGIPGSLPIGIHRPTAKANVPPLSLASYQPDTLLSDLATATSPRKQRTSTSALRRAAYAERDLDRAIDPGLLDFVPREEGIRESDEEEEENSQTSAHAASASRSYGGRGRERAHKILEARNQVPDAGMWRSMV